MSRLRIRVGVYLDADPGTGGQAQYALTVLESLQGYSEQFELIAYCSWRYWQDVCDERGIAHKRVVPLRLPWCAKAVAKLIRSLTQSQIAPGWYQQLFARRIRRDRIDVCFFPVPTTLFKRIDAVSICPIHDLMYKYERATLNPGADRDYAHYDSLFREDAYYEELYAMILAYASVVLVDAELGEEHIRETFSDIRARIVVLAFCAPRHVDEYREAQLHDPQALAERIAPAVSAVTTAPYLYYPAMHRPDKNHLGIIRALKILQDRGIVCNVVFSGGFGPITATIKAEIEALGIRGTVHFLDYVSNEELCYLFAHAVALVMPTFAGPTNIPPLEAMALGCPVLISELYAMPDQAGGAAIHFDPDSPHAIADAIERVWTDPDERARLIERGYLRSAELGFPVFADRLRRVICEAVDRPDTV